MESSSDQPATQPASPARSCLLVRAARQLSLAASTSTGEAATPARSSGTRSSAASLHSRTRLSTCALSAGPGSVSRFLGFCLCCFARFCTRSDQATNSTAAVATNEMIWMITSFASSSITSTGGSEPASGAPGVTGSSITRSPRGN